MGKPTGFLEIERQVSTEIEPLKRIKNFNEFHKPLEMNNHAKEHDAWIVVFLSVKMGK